MTLVRLHGNGCSMIVWQPCSSPSQNFGITLSMRSLESAAPPSTSSAASERKRKIGPFAVRGIQDTSTVPRPLLISALVRYRGCRQTNCGPSWGGTGAYRVDGGAVRSQRPT